MRTMPLDRDEPGTRDEIDPSLLEPVEAPPDGKAIFAVPFTEDELADLEAFARQSGVDEIEAIHDLVMSALADSRSR